MVEWFIIILAVIALIIVTKLIHFKHIKHKIFAILFILFLLFTYFTFVNIVKSHSIDLKTASGVFAAVRVYGSWVVHAFENVKDLTGQAIKMDWIPKNSTG